MTNVTPERKQNVLKTLALFGLLGIIIFIAWLSVQIVSVFPSAVTSLASLADSVYSYDPRSVKDIEAQPVAGPVTSGDAFTLVWKQPLKTGSYTLAYRCAEGVSVEIKTDESTFTGAECEKSYNLGAVDSAVVVVTSEKLYEVDFGYTLAYQKVNATENTTSKDFMVTVQNPRLSPQTETEVTVNDEPITPSTPAEETPTKPTTPVTPGVPTTTYEYTYAIPVSNPNGTTDLVVSFKGIGSVNAAGLFTNTGVLREGTAGAIQFTVHNIGTRTSEDWTFAAELPGGLTWDSETQAPLKPNEKSTLTFNFPAVFSTELQSFSLEVDTERDTNKANNEVTWSTIVIK